MRSTLSTSTSSKCTSHIRSCFLLIVVVWIQKWFLSLLWYTKLFFAWKSFFLFIFNLYYKLSYIDEKCISIINLFCSKKVEIQKHFIFKLYLQILLNFKINVKLKKRNKILLGQTVISVIDHKLLYFGTKWIWIFTSCESVTDWKELGIGWWRRAIVMMYFWLS